MSDNRQREPRFLGIDRIVVTGRFGEKAQAPCFYHCAMPRKLMSDMRFIDHLPNLPIKLRIMLAT